MAEKVSLKIFIFLSLLCGILSACMSPVDIEVFFADEQVKAIVKASKELVKISTDSDPGLISGNASILGLNPDKYYKIEEMEGKEPVRTSFVKTEGTLSSQLGDIGKVPKRVIIGLTNDVTYRVKSAVPYTNNENKIKYFALTDEQPNEAELISGTVTIIEKRTNCYFDLSETIKATNYYEVMKIIYSGNDTVWKYERTSAFRDSGDSDVRLEGIKDDDYKKKFNDLLSIGIYEHDPNKFSVTLPSYLNNMSVMKLPAKNTENDYVFVEYYAPNPSNPFDTITRDFYVLKVKVKVEGDANITIRPPDSPTNEVIALSYGSSNIPINEGGKISISLTADLSSKTIKAEGTTGYNWFYNDKKPANSSTNSIIIGTAPLNTAGTYRIIVEKTVTNITYSMWFILEITQ